MSRHVLAISLGFVAALAAAPPSNTRFEEFTKKFEKTPDQCQVVAAGYLGGGGTEWFVSGGFQPDGTIVIAGVSLGPSLAIGDVKVAVLGKDAPAPTAAERKPVLDKGKPIEKNGVPQYEPFTWKHENATAFVIRLSSDLKKVKSVSRFPWRAGGVTSAAVDGDGNVYLTGPATDGIKVVTEGGTEETVSHKDETKGACDHVYLTRLNPEANKVVWLHSFKGPSAAPSVNIDKAGKIKFQGPDLRTIDANGEQETVTVIPDGLSGHIAVNPKDGTYARGGEHHWKTGREPYRDPTLNIYKPDGKLLYELYNWDGPFVGLDNLRLVSDSAVRKVCYDDDGNLIFYAWSDGGNSVMYREPNDIRSVSKKMDGLGFSAWGANVLSCAYLLKVETKDYKVIGGTLWLAYLNNQNKPNSIWIDSLGFASDGSFCLAGVSAWGLIQTGNALAPGADPAGTYVAVLSKDCSSLRFCSAMPACGKTEVTDGAKWGIVRGKQNGKPMALFLCGAVENEELYGKTLPAPSVHALQKKYGGGFCDGYLLLLDLSKEEK